MTAIHSVDNEPDLSLQKMTDLESPVERDQLPVVVFDGDDTLWITEPLYDSSRSEARAIVEAVGLDGKRWEELQRSIDLENVALLGLSASRFPTSCQEAYEELCREVGVKSNIRTAETIYMSASKVFLKVAPLVPRVAHVLEILRKEFRLILLTQGDEGVQRKRIADSGLREFFDFVRIVPKKTPELLAKLLDDLGANPGVSWMIGNSVPSDINPALSIGMNAIWVDAYVWEHEKREVLSTSEGLTKVSPIDRVLNVIYHK